MNGKTRFAMVAMVAFINTEKAQFQNRNVIPTWDG
jgi:hypothetical protein